MKTLLRKLEDTFADAALLEMGVRDDLSPTTGQLTFAETLEEALVEVAFAEAADYDEIHKALALEHYENIGAVHFDECQYGDNDSCFAH